MPLQVTIEFAETEPDIGELSDVLTEYYTLMLERVLAVGGPSFSVEAMVRQKLDHLGSYAPPNGSIAFARDQSGYLLGCGFLHLLDPDRAELKCLYVRDLARGMGLGHRLIESRIEKARELGASTVLADTLRGNSSLLALYARFGFSETPRYAGSTNDPALDPYTVFRKLDLDPK